MNTSKRWLIGFAVAATLAGGFAAAPLTASAEPNENACHGQWVVDRILGEGVTPKEVSDFFGLGNPGNWHKDVKALCG